MKGTAVSHVQLIALKRYLSSVVFSLSLCLYGSTAFWDLAVFFQFLNPTHSR
jgi:hypothetical protein